MPAGLFHGWRVTFFLVDKRQNSQTQGNTKQTQGKWTRDKLPLSFSVLFLSDSNVSYCQNIDMGHFDFQTQQNRQNTVEIKLNFLSVELSMDPISKI